MPNDSSITVRFMIPDETITHSGSQGTVVNVIVVKKDDKDMAKNIATPLVIIAGIAILLFLFSVIARKNKKLDNLLTRIEDKIPKPFRF